MAKYKYRLGYGLAIKPEKDMEMFSSMSEKGWHLTDQGGFLYRFEQGEPQKYIYTLNTDSDISEDMYITYEKCGWTPVIKVKGMHIFRAKPGTPDIFSDTESELELLVKECHKFGIYALVAGIILAVVFVLSRLFESFWWSIPLVICWCQFVFGFFPFVGLCRQIKKKKA